MSKSNKPKPGAPLSAHFVLTEAEAQHLQSMLDESNRTLDNFVETALKLIINRHQTSFMYFDIGDIGLQYKRNPDVKTEAKP